MAELGIESKSRDQQSSAIHGQLFLPIICQFITVIKTEFVFILKLYEALETFSTFYSQAKTQIPQDRMSCHFRGDSDAWF